MVAIEAKIEPNETHQNTLNGEPRPWRWTVDEFHRLSETGAFEGRRAMLIEGEIIAMMTLGSLHVTAVTMATDELREIFKSGYVIRVQSPLNLNEATDPEPDLAVVEGRTRDFRNSHPTTASLIVEVSDSTLNYDRTTKASLYARGGIADYWIINIPEKRLEVRRAPIEDLTAPYNWSYSELKILLAGDSITPLAAPAGSSAIPVADLIAVKLMTASPPDDIAPVIPGSQLPRPITVLINTHSRRGKMMFQPAIQALRREGVEIAQAHAIKSHRETERILRSEIELGARLVIVGGGDGTLSTCADILVHSEVAMGVLPLGTGNTFMRSIGLPVDLDEAARVIARGHIEAIDVGRVNQQIFLNSVSLGLSAEIASALDKRTKKRLGMLAWPVVGARVIWKHRPLMARIIAGEKKLSVRTHQLLIVNGRYVAGPIAAAPGATVQDSSLDVFTLGGATHQSLAKTTFDWLRGRHVDTVGSKYFTTRKLRIEALRRPLRANVDGEVNETTPLDIEVLPGALRVVVPHDFDAGTA